MSPRRSVVALLGVLVLAMVAAGLRTPPPLPPGPPPTGAIPPEILDAARRAALLPLPERLKAVSLPMLGKPYAIDPLGEGAPPDTDPLARYDAYDCLTFVEEVLALALSLDPSHAAEVRHALRYGAKPAIYANRRHFMELQWLPGNVDDGWLVDTTATYGKTVVQEQYVTADTWRGWGRRRLFALHDEELPSGRMRLDILPLAEAIGVVEQIRAGSLVLTVRANRPGIPLWTTHIGIVIDGPKKQMRNASRRSAMRVLDEDLAWYLGHIQAYPNWPVAGIAVFEPVEYGPRWARSHPHDDPHSSAFKE